MRTLSHCLILGLLALGSHDWFEARGQDLPTKPQPAARSASGELVVVTSAEPWLLALATPVAAHRATDGEVPLLISHQGDSGLAAEVARLRPRRVVFLRTRKTKHLTPEVPSQDLPLPSDLARASIALARTVWGRSERVVLVPDQNPQALLVGASLAAREKIPVLVFDPQQLEPVRECIKEMGVGLALLVGAERSVESRLGIKARIVGEDHLVRALVPGTIHAVVLCRVPSRDGVAGRTSWLAPYYSLVRRAPLVLVDAQRADLPVTAEEAERAVRTFLKTHRLRPRSVLILGGYQDIGVKMHSIAQPNAQEAAAFDLGLEPCSMPRSGRLSSLGVGRIPFDSLEQVSRVMLRSFARKGLLNKPPRATMVSNPTGDLPLAETVSRLTVEELANRKVRVDAFYRTPTSDPKVQQAILRAHLIVYEGHLADQHLLGEPPAAPQGTPRDGDRVPEEPEPELLEEPIGATWEPIQDDAPRPPIRGPPTGWLAGQPVMILQSCYSLKEYMAEQLVGLGGTALVGSVTKIHSASGSTFAHALVHGLLSRGQTLGEALRDARNYFLLLQDLKNARGHREQAKSLRAALSFRLWGDPELRVFPVRHPPRRAEVTTQWQDGTTLLLELPSKRLKKVTTDRYRVWVFPGSDLAGIVRRSRRPEKPRRLLPIHFQRVVTPRGFATAKYKRVSGPGAGQRAVFRLDERGSRLYVLFFPKKEKPDAVHSLRFER